MATSTSKFQKIGEWLQGLMENLEDSDNKKVFKKVLLGFDNQQVHTYGGEALGVTYVTGSNDYTETFGRHNRPKYIESVCAFIIKDHTEARYQKAIKIMDLLHNQFENNNDWFEYIDSETGEKIIRATFVKDTAITLSPNGKKLDIIVVFTLKHHVYK